MAKSQNMAPHTAAFFPKLYLKNQMCTDTVWPSKDTNLSGKVAVITGSNQGLGFEAAKQLLALGLSRLILAVRSLAKGEEAARKLRSEYPKAVLDVYIVDMSSYDSIQAFATKVHQLDRIDIVILNAGIMPSVFKLVEGTRHEETFQVNYLSTVFLCVLLLPTLKAKAVGGPGRMTIVCSGLAYAAQFSSRKATPVLPTLDLEKNFGSDTYNTSKLLLMMFLLKMHEYVSADDVVVNLVDPGYVKGTNLQTNSSLAVRLATKLVDFTGRTLDVGASTYVDAAVTQGKDSHGSYVMGWKINPFASMMYTPEGKETTEKVWNETLKELSFANPLEILQSLKTEQKI
ncbi:unnamed protein product [Periconia digitata]|uniref:Short-chain dehydrogenase/reductase family protein n=1 Tax=Periconia digitata TaxID=1303443 RepID=A0A9W4XWT7_9PLEO|nr:unnamed protein product [Periconia digitata]